MRVRGLPYPVMGMGSPLSLARANGGGVNLASIFGPSDTGWLAYPSVAANLFQDTAGTTPVAADNDPVGRFNDKSGKGNNVTQGTGTKRPLYASNSGKPYSLYDGADDHLLGSVTPSAACTIAFAGRALAFAGAGIGGGAGATSKRAFIGVFTAGQLTVGWGGEAFGTNLLTGDITGADHVFLVTGDGTTRDVYLDGVLKDSRAPTGGPDGSGGAVALGCFNNNGTQSTFWNGRIYAGLLINRRVTAAEIALITSKFTGAYQ